MAASSFLALFGAAVLVSLVQADMFTSIMDLERAIHTEHALAHDLKDYVKKEQARIDQLSKIADDFEEHSLKALDNPERYLSNPINAYLLIKRFTLDWDKIVDDYIRANSSSDFLSSISDKTCNFPDKNDLGGAAVGLHRLQDTYALPTAKLANGELRGITDSPQLTADDCFELGRVAYNAADHYHAIMWMQEAKKRLETENPPTTDITMLLDYLSYSLYVKGNVKHARNLTMEWLEIEHDHPRAKKNLYHYERILEEQALEKMKNRDTTEESDEIKNWKVPADEYRGSEAFLSYERMCRGVPSVNFKYKNSGKLTCQYRRHHPIFYLNPAREETANLNPNMYMYHNVMTDKEIEKVKELAMPKLHRSGVFTQDDDGSQYRFYRTSKSAWINDIEDPLILRLSVKTSALSNLTRDTVEQLQVLNYGIGGHYEPHYDFARNTELTSFTDETGNRIATTIFYMSDVAEGGCTVFPEVGVRICPEKGSMAVWYNLMRNGEGNYNTRHAACPVLSGIKWVATKWYHAVGNEFARPCALDPEE